MRLSVDSIWTRKCLHQNHFCSVSEGKRDLKNDFSAQLRLFLSSETIGNGFYAKNCIGIGRVFDFRVLQMTLTHCRKVRQNTDRIEGFQSIVKNEFLYIYTALRLGACWQDSP